MPAIASGRIGWERAIERETVTRETHAWVRITTRCNNRCRFCLDADAQRMTSLSEASVTEEIKRGRQRGASKLILSGGEASIHPRFLEFVSLGARLGYSKIQVITNGRMFAYPKFLNSAVSVGLTELTVSVHGHDAATHDRLVGVPGAFDQAVAAIRQALRCLVVNIDVCLNRENISHLSELLERFIELGVREFDLLQLIPFGRAFEHFDELAYDISEAMPEIHRALALSRRADMQIWLNRFPPQYLEGFEYLIQDPWKIHDEVNGRKSELQHMIDTGEPLHCESPRRCQSCYMAGYCTALNLVRNRYVSGNAMLRVEAANVQSATTVGAVVAGYWIRARNAEQGYRALQALGKGKIWLNFDSYAGLDFSDLIGGISDQSIERVYVSEPKELERVLAVPGHFQVVAVLTHAIAAHLAMGSELPWSRVSVVAPAYQSLLDSMSAISNFNDLCQHIPVAVSVEGLPQCLALRPPHAPDIVVDSGSLTVAGVLDPLGFVHQYIADFAYAKSRRCAECIKFAECRGIHINFARAHGFGHLVPLVVRGAG